MAESQIVSMKKRFFSSCVCVALVISSLLVGITVQVPNASAGSVNHNVGNLDILWLTDYGRIITPISWGQPQTVSDQSGSGLGYIGLVIDQDNYNHTAGGIDIADGYSPPPPYTFFGDFAAIDINMVVDDGITQKSKGLFQNTGTLDPNDILVEQTAWTVVNKDWALLQWKLNNLKGSDLTGVCIGLEVPISFEGRNFGLGGASSDGGDDIDGYDSGSDVYWAQDDSGSGQGTTLGFGSAIASDPITHYFAADYQAEWENASDPSDPNPIYQRNFYANDTWLYDRLHAANAIAGGPGNITATVGWNDFTIPVGTFKIFTLVIAANDSLPNMLTAIEDARYYFYNVATGFLITEFSDADSATQQIEVYNFGRAQTDLVVDGYFLSVNGGASALTGSWSNNPLPPYEHSVFTVTGGTIGPEGDTIGLYQDIMGTPVLQDEVAFGQEGVAPDPLADESVGRHISDEYVDEWVRNASTGSTWDTQNDVGNVITSDLVLNRVMFNPSIASEGYIELMYKGSMPLDIGDYRIICDAEYIIPSGTILNSNNRFYVLTQANYPAGFDLDDGTGNGDNVYLYDDSGNLLDMVGWSSSHTQGYYMSRIPDGNGTRQGYDDATSIAAEWDFDLLPSLQLTEFYADGTSARIEVYNPRGGDKLLDSRWTMDVGGGTLTGTWTVGTVPADGGYDDFIRTGGGIPGDEGDTISLYYDPGSGSILMDEVSFGTSGVAPDALNGESTARFWNTTTLEYDDVWTREDTANFGSENDVPEPYFDPIIVLNEVMFNPISDPDGRYVVIYNRRPGWFMNVSNFILVSDSVYTLPTYPVVPGGFNGELMPNWSLIIRFGEDSPASDSFFNNQTPSGDNVYLYASNGRLLDMMGWSTPHTPGMCARRVPDGFSSFQGYDNPTSVAAGWVFDSPLKILITEISDSGTSPSQIEVFNPWYPTIDFALGYGFEFESDTYAPLIGSWTDWSADPGDYAVFDVNAGTPLDTEGDTITIKQTNIFIEDVSYGLKGTVPDPLVDESVQRYWDGGVYTNDWGRNTTSGPNFGAQNNIPPMNITSMIMLNEVLFYPNVVNDYFVEIFYRGATPIDISGYKIVSDVEFEVPPNTWLDFDTKFYYLLNAIKPSFFTPDMDSTGDNVYLYDSNGALLDMVGWSTQHTQGGTVCREIDGNGTRDGYDDTSSVAAGWRFDCSPTVRLIKIDTQDGKQPIKYGHLGGIVMFNLTIQNLQAIVDIINFLNSTEEGYTVEIFDETGTIKITDITLGADEMGNITVIITLPDTIPFAIMDNITIEIRSTNSQIIGDKIVLNVRVYPFLNLTKSVDPSQVYINGSGFNEETTLTLNLTGMGAQVAVRKFLDTVFCIDASGSMQSNDPFDLRITESQNFVMNNFAPDDRGAVVEFEETASLLPRPIGDHLSMDYKTIVDNLGLVGNTGQYTYISPGLNISNEELVQYGQPSDHILNIILITDAVSSTQADIDACYVEADIAASHGIIIFTIGLNIQSPSPNELLLQDLANITGGIYFPAPDPSFFSSIYENISQYLADLAVWDDDLSDPNPMIRDVLPPYIEYIDGSASIQPDNWYKDIITGETILEWNVKQIKLGETWTVSFDIRSNIDGLVETNVYSDSRAFYTRWDNTTTTEYFPHTWLNVLPTEPLPPRLSIDILPNKNDIYLNWEKPVSPGTYHYCIYNSTSPTGFDFSSPWIDTSLHIDPLDPGGVAVGDRLSWNHTGAAQPGHLNYSAQWYYCVRSVNSLSQISHTSRTVGAWTRIFPAGNATFSLPLEPLIMANTEVYAQDMNARFIKWMDPGTHEWVQHDQGEAGDNTNLEVGKGYETDFTSSTKYTFLGQPGAMIQYRSNPFVGFDYNTEADSLMASVDPGSGDVTLNWAQPLGMDGNDNYDVYRSTTRDGFDDGSAVLLGTTPYGSESWLDSGAALSPGQNYYMVTPTNETNAEGASTYSIGVWTSDINEQYDTIGVPLALINPASVDYFCENIDNTIGINYLIYSSFPRWGWHSTRMASGAYDPILAMGEAYQISTTATTKFSFVGH